MHKSIDLTYDIKKGETGYISKKLAAEILLQISSSFYKKPYCRLLDIDIKKELLQNIVNVFIRR